MKHLITFIILSMTINSFAQGFCSLRDPQAKIKALFPDCSSYKTLVGSVTAETRLKVASQLPFSLHFSEIGRHNLYQINNGDLTEGFIHVRSEQSRWGLIEIVWFLNLDLTIRDFTFQRCRSPLKKQLLNNDFKQQILGLNYIQLIKLIDAKGNLRNSLNVPKNCQQLVQLLIHSALKTIAVSEISWLNKINKVRQQKLLRELNIDQQADHVKTKHHSESIGSLNIQKFTGTQSSVFEGKISIQDKSLNIIGAFDGSTIIKLYLPCHYNFITKKQIIADSKGNRYTFPEDHLLKFLKEAAP
ncbi:MAG: hypothetical protein HRT88_09870 [Lentisphaeraceae bacterium]|nr:hypothetical protein [Lentisphaeraceae bacterium]